MRDTVIFLVTRMHLPGQSAAVGTSLQLFHMSCQSFLGPFQASSSSTIVLCFVRWRLVHELPMFFSLTGSVIATPDSVGFVSGLVFFVSGTTTITTEKLNSKNYYQGLPQWNFGSLVKDTMSI